MSSLSKTWWKIQRMEDDELDSYCLEHGLDISEMEFDDERAARDYVCEQLNLAKPSPDEEQPPEEDDDDAGTELDRRARAHQREHPGLSYETCLGLMRKKYPALARKYAESFPGGAGKARMKGV